MSRDPILQILDRLSFGAFYALLLWAPLTAGIYQGWPPAIVRLLMILALSTWILRMVWEGRLEWRGSALDLPIALLVGLVVAQLAIGHRPLVKWALASPQPVMDLIADFPSPLFFVGTVAPRDTWSALLAFCTYAGAYFFVVNRIRSRAELDRCAQALLLVGGLLAFFSLIDYLTRDTWVIWWGEPYDGRLRGSFRNPDHAALWFEMLIGLGVGVLAARGRSERPMPSLAAIFTIREAREHAARRYLPLIGVVVMALALIFTLSRAGVLSFLASLLVLLWLFWACARLRWSMALVGTLLGAILAYGSWIGIQPLLTRFQQGSLDAISRWILYRTSPPLLKDFPLFGVGLGAYPQIYFRYQPAELPQQIFFNAAHNDLLQLLIETGALGGAILLLLFSRGIGDLVRAHLLGRGQCPVGGGEAEVARRNDRYSVGIAIGAIGGVSAMLFHSTMDFGARIQANGILAATLLGLATIALHTRFHHHGEQWRAETRELSFSGMRWRSFSLIALVALLSLSTLAAVTVRSGRVEAALLTLSRDQSLASAESVLELDRANALALEVRALQKRQAAMDMWMGRTLVSSPSERHEQAAVLLREAREDIRAAIAALPTNPYLQHRLAWIETSDSVVNQSVGPAGLMPALSAATRALALAPEEPRLYFAMAQFAVTQPELGLRAAREAIRREPALLPKLVDTFLPGRLSDAQWLAMVAGLPVDQLRLATLLEERHLVRESLTTYRKAVEGATPQVAPFFRWMLAQALARHGDPAGALAQLNEALRVNPNNPDLHLGVAQVLAQVGNPDALDSFRLAVTLADQQRSPRDEASPFDLRDPRLRDLALQHLGPEASGQSPLIRYRRALARYLIERTLWAQAASEWAEIIEARPQDAEAHFGIGVALEGLGSPTRALEHLRKAVQLDGNAVTFRKRLADRLWADEQYFQAINEWRAVKSQAPGDVEARLALARAYEKVGDRVEAFREYVDVLNSHPGHPRATEGVARLRGERPR